MDVLEDVRVQFTAVMTDAVPSLLQYSFEMSSAVPRSVPFWVYVGLVPTYVVYIGRYMVCTNPYVRIRYDRTAWYRALKKIIPRNVRTYVRMYQDTMAST